MSKELPNSHGLKRKVLVVAMAGAMASQMAAAETVQKNQSASDELPETVAIVVEGQATTGLDSLISEEELKNYQPNDMAELFRRDPSISAGGGVSIGQKIYLRNIGEDSLHISVDGAEQAASTFHHSGRIAIEPELLKQVEIEAGAGSATAGPGALGGSIRFVTKDPEDLLKEGQNAGGLIKTNYQSNGEGWRNSATFYAQDSSEKFSGMISLLGFDRDNQDDGDGNELAGSESEKQVGFVKLVANFTDEQRFSLSHENYEEETQTLYRSEWIFNERRNPLSQTTSERQTTIANYSFDSEESDLLDFSVNAYNTEHYQQREWGGTYSGTVQTSGFTIQNKSVIGANKLIYGVNYRADDSFFDEVPSNSTAYVEETGKVKGAYIQDIISVSDELTLSAGVRYDSYELTDVSNQTVSDSGFSANVSANYEINNEFAVSLGYGQAFRGPEVRDAIRLSSEPTMDPDVEGETANNLELGFNYDTDGLSVAAGVYRSVIENAILGENGSPWSVDYQNFDKDIETLGYFLQLQKEWDDFTFTASLNSADTEVDGEAVSRYVYSSSAASIGDTLVLSLDYHASSDLDFGWSAEFVRGYASDITINDPDYGLNELSFEQSGYAVHDIYAIWQPSSVSELTLKLGINNLFDEQYLSQAAAEDLTHEAGYSFISATAEEGRNISLSLAYQF